MRRSADSASTILDLTFTPGIKSPSFLLNLLTADCRGGPGQAENKQMPLKQLQKEVVSLALQGLGEDGDEPASSKKAFKKVFLEKVSERGRGLETATMFPGAGADDNPV